jgi:hypothetical protein
MLMLHGYEETDGMLEHLSVPFPFTRISDYCDPKFKRAMGFP